MAGCAALHPPYVLSAQPVTEEKPMPAFRLPLSGNVTQSINPWTWFFNPVGSQVGLVNIELGQSSNPAVEEEVAIAALKTMAEEIAAVKAKHPPRTAS